MTQHMPTTDQVAGIELAACRETEFGTEVTTDLTQDGIFYTVYLRVQMPGQNITQAQAIADLTYYEAAMILATALAAKYLVPLEDKTKL